MDVSSLVKAVQDLWAFVWPPIVCFGILAGIVYAIAGQTLTSLVTWLSQSKPSSEVQIFAAKTLRRVGLDKLLPVLIAFCALFFLDVCKTMVLTIGSGLPPTVVYRYDLWFLTHVTDPEFVCLWAHFDDASEIGELQNRIERTLAEEDETHKNSPLTSNVHYWAEESGTASAELSACKFFLAWSVLWTIVEMLHSKRVLKPFWRSLICATVVSIAGLFFLFRYIWAVDQAQLSRISATKVIAFHLPPSCNLLTEDQRQDYLRRAEHLTKSSQHNRWWELRAFDAYYGRWVWKQMVTTPPSIPTRYAQTSKVQVTAPDSKGTGTVRITSQPSGLDVRIDEEIAGKTPLSVSVQEGQHKIEVQKEGYSPWTRDVQVKAGAEITLSPTFR